MATASAQPKKIKALKVLSPVNGFRRGGIAFSTQPTVIALSALNKEQIKLITSEPKLVTSEVEVSPEELSVPASEEEGEGGSAKTE